MKSIFQHTKINLCIATMAASLGVHYAQAQSDGTLNINGQISNTTCVLNLGDTGATSAGNRTINLGTYTTTVAAAATANGGTFGNAQTVLFSLQNATGTSCTSLTTANQKWDIGINLTSPQIITTSTGTTLLASSGTTGIAEHIGVLLKSTASSTATVGNTNLKLDSTAAAAGGYGLLLSSSSASLPTLGIADRIALTAQFARSNASTPTAGVFSVTIPLNVYYK